MIIDCHGHFTTAPPALGEWRDGQVAAWQDGRRYDRPLEISDDELREAIGRAQLRLQAERGTDLTLFSPRASWMAHHVGDLGVSIEWSRIQNDLIRRIRDLFPDSFAAVCQLPQTPGEPLDAAIAELERCVEAGFVGCNVNPDPTGGLWTGPPLWDDHWAPLWQALVDLDVPAMIHVSTSVNEHFHTTGSHYLGADTTAITQALTSGFMADFPGLRWVVPHGGGAWPYHWGRFKGMAEDKGWDFDGLWDHIWFDTCVYHRPGVELLLDVVPTANVLFGSEMVGAVRGVDPDTGHHYDDTKRYIDALDLDEATREAVFSGNARRVYPRLEVPA